MNTLITNNLLVTYEDNQWEANNKFPTMKDWEQWEDDGEPILLPSNTNNEIRSFAELLRHFKQQEIGGWDFVSDGIIRATLQEEWIAYQELLKNAKNEDGQLEIAHIGFLCMLLWNRSI